MRLTLATALLLAGAAPLAAQVDPLVRPSTTQDEVFRAYNDRPYRPVRVGEVRAARFLTEGRTYPFGRVLGPVAPPRIPGMESGGMALSGDIIAVQPPTGAAYQRGDTIMLVMVVRGPAGWGDIVTPTGLARVGEHTPRQTQAQVLVVYGPIRNGQSTLPLEPVADPGAVKPMKVEGPTGTVIAGSEARELQQVGGEMFLDIGRPGGIRLGDFIEVRRHATPRPNAPDTIDEVMGVGQIVHVGDKTSTIKFTRILDASIPAGTPVVRVSTLPG